MLLFVIFQYISKNHFKCYFFEFNQYIHIEFQYCTTTKQMHPFTNLFITIERLLWLKLRKHITCIIIHYKKYCCEFVPYHAIMEIICNVVNNLGFLLFTIAIQVVRNDILHSIEVILIYLLFYPRFLFYFILSFHLRFNLTFK